MSLAVLELNDQSLLIQAAGGALLAEPGFACLTPEGIETGESAHALAWRQPQHGYNQYWSQLNQTPLAAKHQWARHYADIAFAQLKHLWQSAGSPKSLITLVPGSFTDEQVSLLLGMIGALPCKAHAVIDSALAACYQLDQETLFIEMQLHQSVMTLCRPEGRSMSVIEQEVFSDFGMMQIQNSVARHISDMLIDSYRYDPLHTSDSEQDIFDHLPGWLARLRWESEFSDSLQSAQGEMTFVLRRDDVRDLISERLFNLRSFIARHDGCDVLLSHSSALLDGLSAGFKTAQVIGQTVSMDNGFSIHPFLPEPSEGLHRILTLERDRDMPVSTDSNDTVATHLLFGDRALPLHIPVSIRIGEQEIQLASSLDPDADVTLVMTNRSLETIHCADGVDTEFPASCRPGESIIVNGHRLALIEVQGG